MSNHGKCVSFPIGHPKYMAPEVILSSENSPSGPKCDVWSLGIILAEIALGVVLWSELRVGQIIRKILSLVNSSTSVFERLANEHNSMDVYKSLNSDLKEFICCCLNVNVSERPDPKECLKMEFFKNFDNVEFTDDDYGYHIGFLKSVTKKNVINIMKMLDGRKKVCLFQIFVAENNPEIKNSFRVNYAIHFKFKNVRSYHSNQVAILTSATLPIATRYSSLI